MRKITLLIAIVCSLLPAGAQQIDRFFETKERCSDEIFLRRVSLSLTGRLPSETAAVHFLNSDRTDKRTVLVDSLLNTEESIIYFGNLWGDMLRIKSEFPSNLWPNGVQAYNRWVHEKLTANTPYNEMVSELLLSKGSNFRMPAVNFFRAFPRRTSENIYRNIQLLFMGRRDVPDNGKVFFSQLSYKSTREWKEEIVYINYHLTPPCDTVHISGSVLNLTPETDWRIVWVNWLTSASNKQFAAVMVNRMWCWIMGKGLVNEPDDWRAGNPPVKPELLAYLTDRFITQHFNMKAMMREMVLSYAFQCTEEETGTFITTRLDAEQIVDAIADLTGISEKYSSRVPEPFSFFPNGTHAVELGDATVSGTTLELFGRASRDISLERQHVRDLNSRQLLYLMNSSELEDRIRKGLVLDKLITNSLTIDDLARNVTLHILSRYPTEAEMQLYINYFRKSKTSLKQMGYDMVWMQLNSVEFLYNH